MLWLGGGLMTGAAVGDALSWHSATGVCGDVSCVTMAF